ncbi:MAG: CehA/McbA family metallohydrolase [Terriglobia bacterium]
MPSGRQILRGMPFWLGPEGIEQKSWLILSTRNTKGAIPGIEIKVQKGASFVCLAQFCDWDPLEEENYWTPRQPPPDLDDLQDIGRLLAEAVMLLEDGSEHRFPIRRRFEVDPPTFLGDHSCSMALPHQRDYSTDPPVIPAIWVTTLPNPKPDQILRAIRLEARGSDLLVICGLTLFHGHEDPLRYQRLSLYRITLPEGTEQAERWQVSVDLGVISRTFFQAPFQAEDWLKTTWGKSAKGGAAQVVGSPYLYVEVTATPDATLTLTDTQTGKQYAFNLSPELLREETALRQIPHLEILEKDKVWLQGRVVDDATGNPTPVRLAFRTKDGRYIPPYGYSSWTDTPPSREFGDLQSWWNRQAERPQFGNLKLGEDYFAYVDGSFQVELPVGEVYLEMTKGFEYEVVRQKLSITPDQSALSLRMPHFVDLRSQGWVTADTHVHMISPSSAVLEGQAEGLNLINLLAQQLGNQFSNVANLAQGSLHSRDGDTLVWMGTENRQHFFGHVGLLGGHGAPVFPMSAAGLGESFLGDPLWSTLSEWADACHARGGIAVAAHFPFPGAEWAASVVLGRIDALEVWPNTEHFNTLSYLEWYRYLNCGYRIPVVAGTDKLGNETAVGAQRTYAFLGQTAFNFSNWAHAVSRGNTFVSTGPLLQFHVDGHVPGEQILLGAGGGSVQVRAEARSYVPFHRLEVVLNGRVIASKQEQGGTRDMTLNEKIKVEGPGWLAARCAASASMATNHGRVISAHTSPVYLNVFGKELFSPRLAAYLITQIDYGESWVRKLAIQRDPESYARALKVFVDAREHLHRRLHQHSLER